MNILLLNYRRPDLSARARTFIQHARPDTVLLACDGPAEGEHEIIAAVHQALAGDWGCPVARRYSAAHRGCKWGVVEGINWAFTLVPELIVLEDDIIPEPTFFPFASEMLDRYRTATRIFSVSGCRDPGEILPTSESYSFRRRPYIWGWATWHRAWQHYDPDSKAWPLFRDHPGFHPPAHSGEFRLNLDRVHAGQLDTWDYQWQFTHLQHDALGIFPRHNLIENDGFDLRATHTRCTLDRRPACSQPLAFPLVHPTTIMPEPSGR